MSSNLKVNSLVPATGTEIGIGTTGGSIDFRCPATFGGNVTIGGTLTYDEVINIDSIGIITARSNIDCNGDLDVDGHTNLDNVSIAGVTTSTSRVHFTNESVGAQIRVGGQDDFQVEHDGNDTYLANITGDLVFQNDANIKFTYKSGGTEKVRIYSGGQVSIRNTNATSFNTGGDDLVIGNATDGQDAGITLYSHSSDNGSIFFNDTASTGLTGLIQYRHSEDAMRFITNSLERLRIDSSGHLKPATNDTYNLGTSSFKWANVYIDNYVYVGTTGSSFKDNQLLFKSSGTAYIDHFTTGQDIQFRTSVNSALDTSSVKVTSAGNVAFMSGRGLDFSVASNLISGRGTSTSHILDDYEEGDYTPTFTAQSGTVTLDSNFNTLTYTKIGRQVTIIGMLKVDSVSNPSGIFRAPLPFGRANQTQQGERTMGNIMVVGAAVNNANEFATYPDGGVDSYLEIVSISGTTITRNGGQNMQANATIYVNYTYFTS